MLSLKDVVIKFEPHTSTHLIAKPAILFPGGLLLSFVSTHIIKKLKTQSQGEKFLISLLFLYNQHVLATTGEEIEELAKHVVLLMVVIDIA